MNLALKMLDAFLFLLQPAAGLPVMRRLHSLLHCSRNTVGYYFSSPAITTEDKKKGQKLALGLPHGPRRSAEKSRDQASCATGASSHAAPAQPCPRWRGMKAAPVAPLHPPKTCTALLSRAHVPCHHCQISSHCLKMPPVHSFLPPFPLPHPLPNPSQCLFSLLPLPNPRSCYSSCLPLLSPALLSRCPLVSPQNIPIYKQVKNHMEMSITICSLLYHRTEHIYNSFPVLPSSLRPLTPPRPPNCI